MPVGLRGSRKTLRQRFAERRKRAGTARFNAIYRAAKAAGFSETRARNAAQLGMNRGASSQIGNLPELMKQRQRRAILLNRARAIPRARDTSIPLKEWVRRTNELKQRQKK